MVLLFAWFFIQGCIAHNVSLIRRDELSSWLELGNEIRDDYLKGKIYKEVNGDPMFADSFVDEVMETFCDMLTAEVPDTLFAVETLTETLSGACTDFVMEASLFYPALILPALFGGETLCSLAIGYIVDKAVSSIHLTGDTTWGELTEEFCEQPKPCGNILTDAQNCGKCEHEVYSFP